IKTEDSEWSLMGGLRPANKLGLVKELLARGADPNARLARQPLVGGVGGGGTVSISLLGATPYLLAAQGGDVDMMRLLASSGADAVAIQQDRSNAVILAAGLMRSPGMSTVTERQALDAVKLAV